VPAVPASFHQGDPWPPVGWDRPYREWGLALSAELGLHRVPRSGPVGGLIGLHASHVTAAHSSSTIYAAIVGLTFEPR
jgi:hypothetical protein